MQRGRKPQSPAEHLARGTYRPGRHDGLIEAEVSDDLPQSPSWLTAAGHEAWLDLVPRVTRTRRACELDSFALATLANLVGACGLAWTSGSVPPAAFLSEMRRLQESFGLSGVASRVLAGAITDRGPNPFTVLRDKARQSGDRGE